MYTVAVADGNVSVYETPNIYAAKRIAKRINRQKGIWVQRIPGYLIASHKKFKGAKFINIGDACIQ
jgi:hypothetical protein